ncbi:MAG: response regulator [Alphaproteobacteria bacterium]|nr:response regulator [Alphaproteobacteria bacterium]
MTVIAMQNGAEGESQRVPIPIIALTADTMPDNQDRCSDAGMNDFITKPITKD